MTHRIHPDELNRQKRDEDLAILASWQRISVQRRTSPTDLPGSPRQARAVQDER